MTNYALTKWSKVGDYDEVLADMEEELEGVSGTIRYVDIVKRGNEFVGLLLYDT